MKLVMTLLVRDESDIISANLDFHLAQGVDFVIAMDNLSQDDTSTILKQYESEGVLYYIQQKEDDYNQAAWVTYMARMACSDFRADWVINNDADEFWWPTQGSLKTTLEALPEDVNIVRAPRHNFVMTGDPHQPFWSRMIYREKQSKNSLGKPLPPKVAHRGSETIQVEQGNHAVSGFDPLVAAPGAPVDILHFPIRSLQQIEQKIAKGGAAYERNTNLARSVGSTWRELYRQYQAEGNLANYYKGNLYSNEEIAVALSANRLITDTRLHNFFVGRAAQGPE
jgi:hypothetical protein